MGIISFFAQGIPKGQPRARAFARKIGDKYFARVYDAGTAEAWKSCVAQAAKDRVDKPIDEPVRLELCFFFQRPKSHYRTGKRAGELKDNMPVYKASIPDVDNLYKAVADALTLIGMFRDDAVIVQTRVTKMYGNGPHLHGCAIQITFPENPLTDFALKFDTRTNVNSFVD